MIKVFWPILLLLFILGCSDNDEIGKNDSENAKTVKSDTSDLSFRRISVIDSIMKYEAKFILNQESCIVVTTSFLSTKRENLPDNKRVIEQSLQFFQKNNNKRILNGIDSIIKESNNYFVSGISSLTYRKKKYYVLYASDYTNSGNEYNLFFSPEGDFISFLECQRSGCDTLYSNFVDAREITKRELDKDFIDIYPPPEQE